MPEQDPSPPASEPTGPPVSHAEDTPMLDVHPPHVSVHSWRDFFIHIVTITIGLLIAIGLEQTVERIHHHELVAETREALRVERDNNRQAYVAGISEFHRQTASLINNLIILQYLQQHPGTPQEKLPGILVWHANRTKFSQSAWETAQQSNVTALMAPDEVRTYSVLYDRIARAGLAFDEIWPAIVQARLYSVSDPDPSHLTPAQVANEIELTHIALARVFTQSAALVQLSLADPGFVPVLTPGELNTLMRVSEPEHDPRLADAIALTNSRLPEDSKLPIPQSAP
jgi:hypothetical protein